MAGTNGAAKVVPIETAVSRPKNSASLMLERITRALRQSYQGQAARHSKVTVRKLEALVRQEPMLNRGIQKHSGDVVKHGCVITLPGDETESPADEEVQAFFRDAEVWSKVREALISAHSTGDGYLEIEWDDTGSSAAPPPESAIPVNVHLIDPVTADLEQREDGIYLIQRGFGGDPIVLHPERFHHFRIRRVPGFLYGLATSELAYHVCIAKVKGDQGLGEVLYHSGQAKLHASIKDGNDDDVEAVTKMLNDPDFVQAVVWNDRLTINQLNPSGVNPAAYYDALENSIAASCMVPVTLLRGVQAGQVSGSETNLTDYHSDLRQFQVTELEAFISHLAMGITGLEAGAFDVAWEDWPTLPSAEATRMRELAAAFQTLVSNRVTPEAAARILGLPLEEDDFEEPEPVPQTMTPPVPATGEVPGEDAQPGQ